MQKLPVQLIKKINIFRTFYILTLFILFGGILFRVYCSNVLAVKNTELKELSIKKIELEKEISKLEYMESELSSLVSVEGKARALGFVDQTEALLSLNPDSPAPVAALSNK